MSPSTTPLAGLKVIELARILAGPWIGQTLADLGADVIKVEAPDGDDTRRWGPPFVRDADGKERDAAYFLCCNRGKRSVTADLRSEQGVDFVRGLAAGADVFIENFRVGTLARFGLDHASLAAINPRLVYCSVTGFGQDGPYAHRAGYDAMIQAMGGLMSITGETDGPPQKVGVAIGDLCAGLYGVIAIQAALAQRERTGRGQHVDIALLDTMVAMLANQNLNYLVSGTAPGRLGNAHPNIVPYQVFAVRDGEIMLAVGSNAQFAALCSELDLAGLASDPRFVSNAARVENRAVLVALLAEALADREREGLLGALEQRGVPAGPINTIDQVFGDPQVRHRGLQLNLQEGRAEGGHVPGVRTPIRFSDATLALQRPAPRLGEHTAEVEAELAAGKGAR
ncbi:CaiB/BaiF CoA transferase family protein [Dokdonella immobilis]|uniref:Crotonobetainyl-CoA:carnitine CoA-transferase CaiB n=1 Tax=Dokdonella immobilis TaxID=578942 RepID=A0A1I5ASZ4_9GAMM|nr:CaiB/BaiF CoA-transferase family protein [Dokdonella immobilis]SFN65554.1 Crotonobetainyl-CoA:carnitine CoA-transferase CaiB [Dokdonella immobilis]